MTTKVVNITLCFDDETVIEIHCSGDDPNHWGVQFMEDQEVFCIKELKIIQAECAKVIDLMATSITDINCRVNLSSLDS